MVNINKLKPGQQLRVIKYHKDFNLLKIGTIVIYSPRNEELISGDDGYIFIESIPGNNGMGTWVINSIWLACLGYTEIESHMPAWF